jgi:hypothetical protein
MFPSLLLYQPALRGPGRGRQQAAAAAAVDAVIEAVAARARPGYFLSHYQLNAGPAVMQLKQRLIRAEPALADDIWCTDRS